MVPRYFFYFATQEENKDLTGFIADMDPDVGSGFRIRISGLDKKHFGAKRSLVKTSSD